MKISPRCYALIAAGLFGVGMPFSKLLLEKVNPLQLAGLLYLGAGASLLIFSVLRNAIFAKEKNAIAFKKKDIGWLAGAIISGGILAPAVLMYGLSSTSAATASLLLNFEVAATAILAAVFFREYIGRQIAFAILLLTLASVLLTFDPSSKFIFSSGSILVLVACVLWGIDNNFTRNISLKNPETIVIIKGLGAGSFLFILSLLTGNDVPSLRGLVIVLLVGGLSYGASLVFFILALRGLGTVRAGSLLALAPFIGAGVSLLLCGDAVSLQLLLSLPFAFAGTLLFFRESHTHLHLHERLEHEHMHDHSDIDHAHSHGSDIPDFNYAHSHWHQHLPTEHSHEHVPDINHRHSH
jgi:drug/metabolite transporter (DMT)-like permease